MARTKRVSTEHKPPRNAAARIRAWAGEGSSKKGIARSLGVSIETLNIWMERYPKLQEAMDEGREAEHKVLWNALFQQA